MKISRLLSARHALALVLGCALLGFAPLAGAQAPPQMKVVAVNAASFDRVAKFIETVNADPTSKATMEEMGKDQNSVPRRWPAAASTT